MHSGETQVTVVGSGPNGLAAAITVARAGRSVVVLEAGSTVGGACRSAELTEPGFIHDVGSSIHPLAVASPFMASIDWAGHDMSWVTPPAAVAHPLDDESAVIAWNDLARTVDGLGSDGDTYHRLMGPLVDRFDQLVDFVMRPPVSMMARPAAGLRFGPRLALPVSVLARRFSTDGARALMAGHAAHSLAPLTHPFTAGFALLLGAAGHAVGWPFPAGGAGEITRVLVETLEELGGRVVTDHPVRSIDDIPDSQAVIFALTPRQISQILSPVPASERSGVSGRTGRRLEQFRYGPGVCKVDYLVEGEIPWADPEVAEAGTVHLGGRFEEVGWAEAEVARGHHPDRPFVLLAQHARWDRSRSPASPASTVAPSSAAASPVAPVPVWTYCHVPHGSTVDVADTVDAQIERFAPGFGSRVRARVVTLTDGLEAMNANLVGGDIGGGSYTGTQAVFRPWPTRRVGRLAAGWYMGSASVTPGGGVHGMGGVLAARAALADLQSTTKGRN